MKILWPRMGHRFRFADDDSFAANRRRPFLDNKVDNFAFTTKRLALDKLFTGGDRPLSLGQGHFAPWCKQNNNRLNIGFSREQILAKLLEQLLPENVCDITKDLAERNRIRNAF